MEQRRPKHARTHALRQSVENLLPVPRKLAASPPPTSSGQGGSGSGPGELPLIELGITVARERAKA